MGKDTFRYIGTCMLIYLSLAALELFLLEPVLDMIVQGFWFHFCIYMFLLLIVDPLLTRKLAGKIRWKELIEDGDDLL